MKRKTVAFKQDKKAEKALFKDVISDLQNLFVKNMRYCKILNDEQKATIKYFWNHSRLGRIHQVLKVEETAEIIVTFPSKESIMFTTKTTGKGTVPYEQGKHAFAGSFFKFKRVSNLFVDTTSKGIRILHTGINTAIDKDCIVNGGTKPQIVNINLKLQKGELSEQLKIGLLRVTFDIVMQNIIANIFELNNPENAGLDLKLNTDMPSNRKKERILEERNNYFTESDKLARESVEVSIKNKTLKSMPAELASPILKELEEKMEHDWEACIERWMSIFD